MVSFLFQMNRIVVSFQIAECCEIVLANFACYSSVRKIFLLAIIRGQFRCFIFWWWLYLIKIILNKLGIFEYKKSFVYPVFDINWFIFIILSWIIFFIYFNHWVLLISNNKSPNNKSKPLKKNYTPESELFCVSSKFSFNSSNIPFWFLISDFRPSCKDLK